jgi:Alkaline phosphatase PhoX
MLCLAFAVAVLGVVVSAAPAVAKKDGFKTSSPAMMTPGDIPGVEIEPLLTVGDEVGSYRFEAIPDGISLKRKDHNRFEAFVNHETGKSPFPWNINGGNNETNAENDFDNSQLSRLTFNADAEVLKGSFAITSPLGYQRFCSNYLATWRESFNRPVLFTNEESPDYFARQETSWPALPIGGSDEQEAGFVVALEPKSGKQRTIPGMGRHNHENSVPIPGYGHPVVLSGDDTFTSGPLSAVGTTPSQPAQSQLYSYIAKSANDVLKDRGDLYAFVSDNLAIDDYYDFLPGSGTQVSGHFIKVPRDIATGLNPDGSDTQAEDHGYPEPPNDLSWQPEPRFQGPNPVPGVDGPQWVLNHWGDLQETQQENKVFQFVRVEDIAYDKRPGMGNVVYIADSGRGRRVDQSQDTPNFKSTNGRVWKMVFDKEDPTVVTSLSVFVEGDDNRVKLPTEIHQPDNLESTPNGILVTEDPGSSQQFTLPAGGGPPTDPEATTARLWHVPLAGEAGKAVAARVDQSLDGPNPAGGDVDGRAPGPWGGWESTGVVDASRYFGAGAFLINVQAHTLWIQKKEGEDNFAPFGRPDFMYKREGGQLMLIRIPGG